MAADLVITVTMLYGLIKAKKGLAHTNKVSRITAGLTAAHLARDPHDARITSPRNHRGDCPAGQHECVLSPKRMLTAVVMPSNQLGFSIIAFHSKIYTLGLFYSLNMRNGAAKTNAVTMNISYPVS